MKRILLMVFRNLWFVPWAWCKLCYRASHTDKYTEEEQYSFIRWVDLHANKGGNVKKSQLAGLGIDYRRILDFVEKGDILRIKSGYYAVHLSDFTEEELVAKLFPDCVLNLENALYAYGYIKKKPYGWRLAVDKNTSKSRFKMDYPKIIPMYAEPETLQLGVTEIQLSDVTVRIFEKERLICECLKYEDKMDRERFKEGLMAYIKDPKKDIAKLMYYAKERKVVKKVQNMIGVWL